MAVRGVLTVVAVAAVARGCHAAFVMPHPCWNTVPGVAATFPPATPGFMEARALHARAHTHMHTHRAWYHGRHVCYRCADVVVPAACDLGHVVVNYTEVTTDGSNVTVATAVHNASAMLTPTRLVAVQLPIQSGAWYTLSVQVRGVGRAPLRPTTFGVAVAPPPSHPHGAPPAGNQRSGAARRVSSCHHHRGSATL